MEWVATVVAGVVTIATGVIGYLQFVAKGNISTMEEKMDSNRKRIAEQETKISSLLDSHKKCEESSENLRNLHNRMRLEMEDVFDVLWNLGVEKLTAIVESDGDGTITKWSPEASVMFRYMESEALGKDVTMLVPHVNRQAHLNAFRKISHENRMPRVAPLDTYAIDSRGKISPVTIKLTGWSYGGKWSYSAEITPSSRAQIRNA